jgi:hypothetical protein
VVAFVAFVASVPVFWIGVDGMDRMDGMDGKRLVALGALVAALALGCADGATCTQGSVDACFAGVGCDVVGTCSLVAEEMNALCECLGALGCDQGWYHAYCDGAPYPPDAGCPACGE